MKKLLEIHILQNFAPSNLNRDDTGSPKDTIFGGYRRARVSSQCFKRAMRDYLRNNSLIASENLAFRTKGAVDELKNRLVEKGRNAEDAEAKATAALSSFKFKTKDGNKTEYVLFLGEQELSGFADLIQQHWDDLNVSVPEETSSEDDNTKGKKKKSKSAAAAGLPAEFVKSLHKRLDGGKAVDLALFGRMLADYPAGNEDAACQVSHAISTHKLERGFDFFTAVDDLNQGETTGADMMGTVEFNSACFYRYFTLDIQQLELNLQNDYELSRNSIGAFIKAAIHAKPSGKQNSFAAHNDPEYVVITLRQDADPRNLANAFEKPAYQSRDLSLTEASIQKFESKWKKLETAYSEQSDKDNTVTLCLNLSDVTSDLGKSFNSLETLIKEALERVSELQQGV